MVSKTGRSWLRHMLEYRGLVAEPGYQLRKVVAQLISGGFAELSGGKVYITAAGIDEIWEG